LGDGLCLTAWSGEKGRMRQIGKMPYPHSYGLLYSTITGYLGFRPFRHEGKLTGLAALGDKSNIGVDFPFSGEFPNRKSTVRYPLHGWLSRLDGHRREDICAWLQAGLEDDLAQIISHYLRSSGHSRLAVAGGVFANVRLNQIITERCDILDLFVFPNMGDAGLSVGAAQLMGTERWEWGVQRLEHVFLGADTVDSDIEKALQDSGLNYCRREDRAKLAAAFLADGKIVARCSGRMELGPRALGNRSILANASDPTVNSRLNRALRRSDFMPFAPIIREENVEDFLLPMPQAHRAAAFMTVNMLASENLRRLCPAIVHVDGSLRPQIVGRGRTPELWEILSLFQQQTSQPALINTSFNIHEEPIVATAEEAVRAFKKADLDALILGEYWLT
jgi:carbamoyltransferase